MVPHQIWPSAEFTAEKGRVADVAVLAGVQRAYESLPRARGVITGLPARVPDDARVAPPDFYPRSPNSGV